MTKPLRRVRKAKLEIYRRMGTCSECGRSIVWSRSGRCRRCAPVVLERKIMAAAAQLEAERATLFFHYWLTVRKKDASPSGVLARRILGDKRIKRLRGLEAIASETTEADLDVKVLETAWETSEAERKASS